MLEALSADSITPISAGQAPHRLGAVQLRHQDGGVRIVWAFDLAGLMRGTASTVNESQQVVVVQLGAVAMGLLVDGLQGVPEFHAAQIMPAGETGGGGLVQRLISADAQGSLIPVLDLAALVRLFGGEAVEAVDEVSAPEVQPT